MAAEASECARGQGRFDEYHDGVYELLVKREGISAASLGEVAGRLGLDMSEYEACTRNRTHRERVEADKEYGRSLGVQGTPALFINGEQLDWYSYRNLVDQIPGTTPTLESRERTAREIWPPFVQQRRDGETTKVGGGNLTQASTPVLLRSAHLGPYSVPGQLPGLKGLSCHWNAYVNCPGAASVAGGGGCRPQRWKSGTVSITGSCRVPLKVAAPDAGSTAMPTPAPPGAESAAIARTISRATAATIITFLTGSLLRPVARRRRCSRTSPRPPSRGFPG